MKAYCVIVLVLTFGAIAHGRTRTRKVADTDMDEYEDEENFYEGDVHVERFVQRMSEGGSNTLVYPDFQRGRLVAYKLEDNGFTAVREQAEDRAVSQVQCSNLVPDSYDFQHCDYKHRRAVFRKRFAVPSASENDCVLRDLDVHVDSPANDTLLRAWGFNCDCDQWSLSRPEEAEERKLAVKGRASSSNQCTLSLTDVWHSQRIKANGSLYAYVLGCNFQTGKISLLPMTDELRQFTTAGVVTLDSQLCQCNSTNFRADSFMFANCSGADKIPHSDDSSVCKTKSGVICAASLPRFLKIGNCNFTSGYRNDEAYFFHYDPLTRNLRQDFVSCTTRTKQCDCTGLNFSPFAYRCDYQYGTARTTEYSVQPDDNGSSCVITSENSRLAKSECACDTSYRFVAPPICEILANSKKITSRSSRSNNNDYCPLDKVYGGATRNDSMVYSAEAQNRLRAAHNELNRVISSLFNETADSTCECSKKIVRIPLSCSHSLNYGYAARMRFLTLTRRRGTFFCVVDKKTEYMTVNSKYCADID